jgi:ElaB/YqjD/DUF883 family membrane-anchored ribosome-binding protein
MSIETDQIEADVDSSRHRLNDTLQAMGNKLSPGEILDEALGLARGQGGEFAANLGRQVRDNPMPTLLIAAGVGMLLLNKGHRGASRSAGDSSYGAYDALDEASRMRRFHDESEDDFAYRRHDAHCKALNLTQRAGETLDAFKQRVSDSADAVRQAGSSIAHKLGDKASQAMHSVSDGAQSLGQKAGDLKDSAADFYDQNPLVTGVIGLALGALMGSSLPLSDTERDALEGVADRAAKTTADVAERGAQALEQRTREPMH